MSPATEQVSWPGCQLHADGIGIRNRGAVECDRCVLEAGVPGITGAPVTIGTPFPRWYDTSPEGYRKRTSHENNRIATGLPPHRGWLPSPGTDGADARHAR